MAQRSVACDREQSFVVRVMSRLRAAIEAGRLAAEAAAVRPGAAP